MSWLDDMPPSERAELRDAGRIGASRFEGPAMRRPDYPEHGEDCILNCTVDVRDECRILHGCDLCADLEDIW